MDVAKKEGTRWVLGHRITPIETIGDYGMVAVTSLPGVPGPPPHHHEDASEMFYVSQGRLDVMLDGEWRTLSAGESLCIPKGTIHTLKNNGTEDCHWVTAWSPRGFEKFFEQFGIPVENDNSFEESVSETMIHRVGTECGDLGMIVKD